MNKEHDANEPIAEAEVPDTAGNDAVDTELPGLEDAAVAENIDADKVQPDEAEQSEVKDERPPLPPLPESISINEFREKPLSEIYSMLEVLPVKIPAKASKSQLVFDLVSFYAKEGVIVEGEGVLEQAKDNYAMLRDPVKSFKTSPDDLYLNGNLIREHGLVVGQKIKARL